MFAGSTAWPVSSRSRPRSPPGLPPFLRTEPRPSGRGSVILSGPRRSGSAADPTARPPRPRRPRLDRGTRADRRAGRDPPCRRVRLGRADDRVRLLLAARARRAEPRATPLDALLDEHHVAQEVLDRPDPTLGEGLLAPGLVVVGVLLEVAQLAGGHDPGDDRRAGQRGQLVELSAERLQPVRGEAGRRLGRLAGGRLRRARPRAGRALGSRGRRPEGGPRTEHPPRSGWTWPFQRQPGVRHP